MFFVGPLVLEPRDHRREHADFAGVESLFPRPPSRSKVFEPRFVVLEWVLPSRRRVFILVRESVDSSGVIVFIVVGESVQPS